MPTRLSQSTRDITDPLTECLRAGASKLIAQAVEAELKTLLNRHADIRLQNGRHAVVRNGYLPERTIKTAIGEIGIKVPKARDLSGSGIIFRSKILPPYTKRTHDSTEDRSLGLYLKNISTGDFRESLTALLGNQAKTLSPSTISHLNDYWLEKNRQWRRRDLTNKHYNYWWIDGIHNSGQINGRPSLLVVTGITEQGRKELLVVEEGDRESATNWEALLTDLRARGLNTAPQLSIGDGALGVWEAMTKVYPTCRHQHCWAHKTEAILNKLPEPKQPSVKEGLHDIWMATTRDEAHAAFDRALAQLKLQHPLAMDCLTKYREELLALYNFPANHWTHIRRPTRVNPPAPHPEYAHAIAFLKTQRWLRPASCR
ncbi:MAG: IS256 family transposase [Halopseudomonas sp.]